MLVRHDPRTGMTFLRPSSSHGARGDPLRPFGVFTPVGIAAAYPAMASAHSG